MCIVQGPLLSTDRMNEFSVIKNEKNPFCQTALKFPIMT